MNITDELRKYASAYDHVFVSPSGNITWSKTTDYKPDDDDWQPANTFLVAIADRIDAEHERQLEVLYRDMSDAEYVELPKDADGEYIRVGDRMQVVDTGLVFNVTLLRLINSGWVVNPVNFVPSDLRHYHAPTVEDVLREFVTEFNRDDSELCDGEIIERYAAKLQLRKDE